MASDHQIKGRPSNAIPGNANMVRMIPAQPPGGAHTRAGQGNSSV
jgi:hypothetical protein